MSPSPVDERHRQSDSHNGMGPLRLSSPITQLALAAVTQASALRGTMRTAGSVGSTRQTRRLVAVVLTEPCSASSARMGCATSG